MSSKPHIIRIVKFFLVFSPLVAYWLYQPTIVKISGLTMGTSYTIKVYTPRYKSTSSLKQDIDNRLIALNKSMSTWDKNSEISNFNNHLSKEKFVITKDFFNVMKEAKYIHNITDGAWDGTIKPILDILGFSSNKRDTKEISKEKINTILSNIGFDKIDIAYPNFLVKKNKNITIDLSSIAKGYGVDEIAKLLDGKGIKSYFVEIGGEVFAKNKKGNDKEWRIGISSPNIDNIEKEIFHIISLNNQAIATSGDYRNFIMLNNKKISHIINPKTLMPAKNNITSVSVIAPNTMLADALATSFMVIGVKKSIKLCESLEGVETFIIVKNKDNIFSTITSSGFSKLTSDK